MTHTEAVEPEVRVITTRPRLRQAQPLSPFAANLHRIAAFLTERQLPEGDVLILRSGVVVIDLTERPHVRGDVTAWAMELNTTVTDFTEVAEGRLWRYFEAKGRTPDLTLVRVVARELVQAVA